MNATCHDRLRRAVPARHRGSASSPRVGGKADLNLLHEWGLGGRRFGTIVTWFLLGGDLYTAYTFIAVPALVYGKGAIGFFAVPYTILIYPILFWSSRGSGRSRMRAATSRRPTSCATASAAACSRSPWR